MRILSKFNDYYDALQSYGQDQQCVYVRATTQLDHGNDAEEFIETLKDKLPILREFWMYYSTRRSNGVSDQDSNSYTVVGANGNVYLAHRIAVGRSDSFSQSYEYKTFYSKEQILDFISKIDLNTIDKRSYKDEVEYSCLSKLVRYNTEKDWLFLPDTVEPINIVDFFIEFGVANFTVDFYGVHKQPIIQLNPKMQDYEFYRVKEPFYMYQETFQFISGVLTNIEKEPIQISDKDMIAQKGFDPKYGFRKEPTKNKKQKR